MKETIEYVKNKIHPGGWIGMNAEAAKPLNVPFRHKHPKHTIVVYKKVPKKVRVDTIRHEEMEKYEMERLERKGYSPKRAYHIAHYKYALPYEKLNKPFPKKNIKRTLEKEGFKV